MVCRHLSGAVDIAGAFRDAAPRAVAMRLTKPDLAGNHGRRTQENK
jgi:hypothetical protein